MCTDAGVTMMSDAVPLELAWDAIIKYVTDPTRGHVKDPHTGELGGVAHKDYRPPARVTDLSQSKNFKVNDPSTHMPGPPEASNIGPGSTGESCKTCAAPSTGGECQNEQCATNQKSGQTGVSNNLGKIKPHTIVPPAATASNAGGGQQEIQGRLEAHVNDMHGEEGSGAQSGSVSSAPKKTRAWHERMTDWAKDSMTPQGQGEMTNVMSENFGTQAHDPNAGGMANLGNAATSFFSSLPSLSDLRTKAGLNIAPAGGWQ